MITIESRHKLSSVPPSSEFLYIQSTQRIYRYQDGWIEKAYFSTTEAAKILGYHTTQQLRCFMTRHGFKRYGRSGYIRIPLEQMRAMMVLRKSIISVPSSV